MARTDTLPHFLTDIADAIREKTGNSDPITASDFDTEISNISGGGQDISYYIDNSLPGDPNSPNIANYLKHLPPITLQEGSTAEFFTKCTNLIDVDVSYFGDANEYVGMFNACYNLESVVFHGFNSNEPTGCTDMFTDCYALTSIDMSMFTFNSVIDTTFMFNGCTSLQFLDIRQLDFTALEYYDDMFTVVPEDCLIVVANDTQKTWLANNMPELLNVQTVAEYEGN